MMFTSTPSPVSKLPPLSIMSRPQDSLILTIPYQLSAFFVYLTFPVVKTSPTYALATPQYTSKPLDTAVPILVHQDRLHVSCLKPFPPMPFFGIYTFIMNIYSCFVLFPDIILSFFGPYFGFLVLF